MQAGPKILQKMCKCFPFPWSFCQYFSNKSTLLFLFSISMVILSIFWQQQHSSVFIFHFHGCSVNILATEALFCFYFPFLRLFCQYFGNRSTLLFLFSISTVVLSIFWQQKHPSVSIFHFYGCSVNILATEAPFCFYFPFLRLFCQYFGNRSTLLFLFSISTVVLSIFWQQKHPSVSIFHFYGCSVNILATEAPFCFYFPFLRLFCQYFGNRSTLLFLFSISTVVLSIFWQHKHPSHSNSSS